jgi:hypothetical protein
MNILYHNRTNFEGIEAKIAKLPHFITPTTLGYTADWLGTALNLPEFGVSEALANSPTTNTAVFGTEPTTSNNEPINEQLYTNPYSGSLTTASNIGPTTTNTTTTQPTTTQPTQQQGVDYDALWRQQHPGEGDRPVGWFGDATQSQDQLMQQIEDAYKSSYDYFNQAEGNLRSQLPQTLQSVEGNFNVNKNLLDTQNKTNSAQLAFQKGEAGQANESQAAKIRRLYNELNQGYRQRFGGATSAGQAASELANVEQQRQTGSLAQNYASTIQKINLQKMEIDQKYQDSILQLNQQKQDAIMQANQDFQNNLLKITQARVQTDQDKSAQRLNALMDYRNKIFTIEQQNQQFQQTLEAQKQAAQLQLNQYSQTASTGLSTASGATSGFTGGLTQPQSNLKPGATGMASADMMNWYQGQIAQGKKWNPLTGQYE